MSLPALSAFESASCTRQAAGAPADSGPAHSRRLLVGPRQVLPARGVEEEEEGRALQGAVERRATGESADKINTTDCLK